MPRCLYFLLVCAFLSMPHVTSAQSVHREMQELALELDGQWRIAYDSGNAGLAENWQQERPPDTNTIKVPSCFEETPEGAGYDGVVWYYRDFRIPGEFAEKALFLEFDAVNYACRAWLNGVEIGSHRGGYHGFRFPVGEAARLDEENRLVVRVVDPGLLPVDGLSLRNTPHGKESWYFNFGGIYRPVRLLGLPAATIEDVFVKADPKTGRVAVDFELTRHEASLSTLPLEVRIAARNNMGKVLAETTQSVEFGEDPVRTQLEFTIDEPTLWSPAEPFLYRLKTQLGDVSQSDVEFGFRSFTVENGDFLLNGRPIFLRAVLYQPYYPQTLAYPIDQRFAEGEVGRIQSMGFNMVRFHQGPAPAAFLHEANLRGLLVLEEPPLGWLRGPIDEIAEPALAEVEAMVRRDRNHPCVVAWGTISQGGGNLAEMGELLARRALQIDPTRIVFGDWPFQWAEAPAGACKVYLPDQVEPTPIAGGQMFPPAPLTDEVWRRLNTLGSPDAPTFLSAVGSGGITNLDRILRNFRGGTHYEDYQLYQGYHDAAETSLREYRLDRLGGGLNVLCDRAQEVQGRTAAAMIEAVRANPNADGYCYSQWRDAGWECGPGVLDVWNDYKRGTSEIQRANSPLHFALHCTPAAVAPDGSVRVEAAIVNDAGASGPHRWQVTVRRADGREAGKFEGTADLDPDRRLVALETMEAGLSGSRTGTCRIRAELKDPSGRTVVTNDKEVFYTDSTDWSLSNLGVQLVEIEKKTESNMLASGLRLTQPGGFPDSQVLLASTGPDFWNDRNAFLSIAGHLVDLYEQGGTLILDASSGEIAEALGKLRFLKGKAIRTSRGFLGKFFLVGGNGRIRWLPTNRAMMDAYTALTPETAIIPDDPDWEPIVSVVDGYGRFAGHALAEKRWGAGRVVLLTLPVFDRLHNDPAARVLCKSVLDYYEHHPRTGNPGQMSRDLLIALYEGRRDALMRFESGTETSDWWVCGPFGCENLHHGLTTPYPPEIAGDPARKYPVEGGGSIEWRRHHSERPGFIDFSRALGNRSNAVAYALTYAYVDRDTVVELQLGSDDALKVFVNGKEVFAREVNRPAAPNQDTQYVQFDAGWNAILLKVVNGSSDWQAYLKAIELLVWSLDKEMPETATE